MYLTVPLAVGLRQYYNVDVPTLRVLWDIGHLSLCPFSPFESQFRAPFFELLDNIIRIAM